MSAIRRKGRRGELTLNSAIHARHRQHSGNRMNKVNLCSRKKNSRQGMYINNDNKLESSEYT